MDELNELEPIIITIETDNGKVSCTAITTFEIDQQNFIALMPENTDEILLFKYKELDGDAIEIINIENENEFQEALRVFDSLMIDIEGDK